MTISELAQEAVNYFETKQRDSGETFVSRRDDTPEWVQELIQDAHGGMLPDDWRYQAIRDVLQGIADVDADTVENARDADHEVCDGLVSIYTRDLTSWLGSRNDRPGYVDDAVEDLGYPGSIIQAIQQGQYREYMEVYHSIVQSLETRLEELETA